MLSMSRLIQLRPFVKWNAVFKAAGLNPNTMRSAMWSRRRLTEEESEAILSLLEKHGIRISEKEQGELF